MIPQQFIDNLNHDADLASVIGRHVQLAKKGSTFVGLCPFHNEKTPSFNVVADKGFYHCFGCGASGNALTFLMAHAHGNDFVAAVEDLAQQLGRSVPRDESSAHSRQAPLAELLQQMQNHYHANLLSKMSEARAYLRLRGISKETAQAFGLGYVPRDGGFATVFKDMAKVKHLLVAAGLAKEKGKGKLVPYFWNRITFPIHSSTGRIAGFGGRIIGAGKPKYLNSPQSAVFDKGRLVYGLREATAGFKEEGHALVVEGYMDVVVLAQHGLRNAVATMGTTATPAQLRAIFTRAGKVIFCFDGDRAGRQAADKALANVMPALADGKEILFAFLPDGTDPDSYVSKHGAAGMREFLQTALPLDRMLVQSHGLDESQVKDAATRTKLWRRAAGLIELLDPKKAPFFKEELYRQLSGHSGIAIKDLKQAAGHVNAQASRTTAQRPKQGMSFRKMKDHGLYRLLVCLAARPELLDQVLEAPVQCDKRSDAMLCAQVVKTLGQAVAQGERLDLYECLQGMGHFGLVLQLQASVRNKSKSKEFDYGKELAAILGKMARDSMRRKKHKDMEREMADK